MTITKKQTYSKLKPLQRSIMMLWDFVSKMYDKGAFNIETLRRKFSPVLKTWQTENRFGLRLKHSEFGIKCIFEPLANGINYVLVYATKFPKLRFRFCVTSNKDFMQKLIKHQLLY